MSIDFLIADNDDNDDERAIPVHDNVIKNYANVELYSTIDDKDCIGWVTIMELCDCNLRERLKEGKEERKLTLEERKRIAIGVREGEEYLGKIGLFHYDQKPENILLKDGIPKWIDFGIVEESTQRKSYRQMGYVRSGSKFTNWRYLCKFLTWVLFDKSLIIRCRICGIYRGCSTWVSL